MAERRRLAAERGRPAGANPAKPAEKDCDAELCLAAAALGPTADPRRALLVELYGQGWTISEIAQRMGIGADWVRQLLRRYEVPAVPLWERRYRQAITGREPEIVAAFLRLHRDNAVAQELALHPRHVRRLVDAEVPEAGVLRRGRRNLTQTYSEEEMIRVLRRAALDVPSPMTIESYRAWAQFSGNGHRWPGPEVIKLRYGGWRNGLARAGLPTNSRYGPHARFAYPDVVAAVAAAWRDLGRYPSVMRFDAWRAGRRHLPAAATARRFARSWDDLLVAAYPLVYPVGSGRARYERLAEPAGPGDAR
jgi:AraC-like DNA-binding protein